MQFAFILIVGALAWRGSAGVIEMGRMIESNRPNILLRNPRIILFAYSYLCFLAVAMIANGFAKMGLKGVIVLPFVTWVAFQIIDVVIEKTMPSQSWELHLNPIVHFFVFGVLYFILTVWAIWTLIHG